MHERIKLLRLLGEKFRGDLNPQQISHYSNELAGVDISSTLNFIFDRIYIPYAYMRPLNEAFHRALEIILKHTPPPTLTFSNLQIIILMGNPNTISLCEGQISKLSKKEFLEGLKISVIKDSALRANVLLDIHSNQKKLTSKQAAELFIYALAHGSTSVAEVLLKREKKALIDQAEKIQESLFLDYDLHSMVELKKLGLAEGDVIESWSTRIALKETSAAAFETALISVFLATETSLFERFVRKLAKKITKKELLARILHEIECWGPFVFKNRGITKSQRTRSYGRFSAINSSHQKIFGLKSYEVMLSLKDALIQEPKTPLKKIFHKIANWRADIQAEMGGRDVQYFRNFKTDKKARLTTFFTSGDPFNRYSPYEKVIEERYLRTNPEGNKRTIELEQSVIDHKGKKIALTFLDFGIFTGWQWSHDCDFSKILPYLEYLHKQILSIKDLNGLDKAIAEAYWAGVNATPLERGSSHLMLIMRALWYSYHGFTPPATPFELGLYDCYALCTTQEEFVKITLSMQHGIRRDTKYL